MYLADQKLAIEVPRVRDLRENVEVPLATYQRLQEPRGADEGVMRRILAGLSCREYARCAEAVPEAFGLSASTVSRRYKRASARKLRELAERRLEKYDLVAIDRRQLFLPTAKVIVADQAGTWECLHFLKTASSAPR